ncbi:phospholipase A2 [Brachionichthys hirsutus]|uniref:phospholipase A2 n=1 Tax=Brachionichthys hirsutus TaxID=412623 RepID=UPI0036050FEF
MKVITSLLLLLLSASMASGDPLPKALWQFAHLIRCPQPDVNPLKYNQYGCWCGLGGTGTPLDALDVCCEVHDKCYRAARTAPGCTAIADLPYVLVYEFTCSNLQLTCSATNSKCQAAVCECDREAANCFARAEYNPEHKDVDRKVHCVD